MSQFLKTSKRIGVPAKCINTAMSRQMVDDIVVLQKDAHYISPKVDTGDHYASNSNKSAAPKPEFI